MNPNNHLGLPLAHHEAQTISTYSLPGVHPPPIPIEWVRNVDGTPLLDHNGNPVSVNQLLATKPLKLELCSRPGPGGKKLTYLSGEGVTRTLNEIFGYDGWNLDIKETTREECVKDENERFHVAYTSRVRLTHRKSGAYKEDCGAGDSIDRSMGTAIAHAMKASVTDAMKRAARHFGDKLGNSLYGSGFNISKAPGTLQQALDLYEKERAKSKFGPQPNQLRVETDITPILPVTVPSAQHTIQNAVQHQRYAQQQPRQQQIAINTVEVCPLQQQATIEKSRAILGAKPFDLQPTHSVTTGSFSNSDDLITTTPHQNANKHPMPLVTPINQPQCRILPPPTPTEGLQSSNLFGIGTFSDGCSGVFTGSHKENQPPPENEFEDLEFDFAFPARPLTSTGRKSPKMPPPSMAGKRQGVASIDIQKKCKPNPYL